MPVQIKTSNRFRLSYKSLAQLLSHDGVPYASGDLLFKNAIFGRDALEAAEDLLLIYPRIAKNTIKKLASLQGTDYNNRTEEEPGRIHHEHRSIYVDGHQVNSASRLIIRELSKKWGGDGKHLTYYGSVDATPLFIRLLGKYCHYHGCKLLNEAVRNKEGRSVKVLDSLMAATDWLIGRLEQSDVHLLEYKRVNPRGIENQVWKDSREFYIHTNGKYVNHSRPVASIEVQGYAYDALLFAAELIPWRAEELRYYAYLIQQMVLKLLWLPKIRYFALGIDRNLGGKPRLIKTLTANPANLLDSRIFTNLDDQEQRKYLSGIIEKVFSSQFLTDAGVRSRSLVHADILKYWDYHGSFSVWPKETYDIARGLRLYGFSKLAKQLENRLVNVWLINGSYPELVFVDKLGRVIHGVQDTAINTELNVKVTNMPEAHQTWTLSSLIAIQNCLFETLTLPEKEWKKALQKTILRKITNIGVAYHPAKQMELYPYVPYTMRLKKLKSFKLSKLGPINILG